MREQLAAYLTRRRGRENENAMRTATTSARPFVKMAGGKTQLLPELLARIPERFGNYHEPFVGGGALYWALAGNAAGVAFLGKRLARLSDMNNTLIRTYQAIQENVEEVIARLRVMPNEERFYYKTRSRQLLTVPKSEMTVKEGGRAGEMSAKEGCSGGEDAGVRKRDGHAKRRERDRLGGMKADEDVRKREGRVPDDEIAAWYIYLNKTCFNGLHRVNRKGEFNVPFGHSKNTVCDADNLRACARVLQGVKTEITVESFEAAAEYANKGDLVYFDPPYLPLSKTSNFVGYTSDGFGLEQHGVLRDVALALKKRGVHVLISNSDEPRIRELYTGSDFQVDVVQARRSVNSKGTGRGAIAELLVR